jgi:hypothetical protein
VRSGRSGGGVQAVSGRNSPAGRPCPRPRAQPQPGTGAGEDGAGGPGPHWCPAAGRPGTVEDSADGRRRGRLLLAAGREQLAAVLWLPLPGAVRAGVPVQALREDRLLLFGPLCQLHLPLRSGLGGGPVPALPRQVQVSVFSDPKSQRPPQAPNPRQLPRVSGPGAQRGARPERVTVGPALSPLPSPGTPGTPGTRARAPHGPAWSEAFPNRCPLSAATPHPQLRKNICTLTYGAKHHCVRTICVFYDSEMVQVTHETHAHCENSNTCVKVQSCGLPASPPSPTPTALASL